MSYLFSLGYLLLVLLIAILFFPIALIIRVLTSPFDQRLRLLNYFSHFWGAVYFWSMPYWRVNITGRHHFKKDQTYVIVSNHASALDVLVPCLLFVPFKWVSKIENFRIPFIGWTMSLNRYIPIRRGGLSSIKAMMHQAKHHLAQGSSIFIFPEGARSADGQLTKFKTGAFKLAKEMDVAVMPVVLHGTSKALPKSSLHFTGRHRITVEVLPAIEPSQHQELSLDELTQLAQRKIASALENHDNTGVTSPAVQTAIDSPNGHR